MRSIYFVSLFLLLAACQPAVEPLPEPEPVTPDEREEAIALLERAGTDMLDRAFGRLNATPHTMRERLHQLDEAGRVNAFRRRTVAIDPPESETVFAEAEGTFDFGAFGRFVSLDDLDDLPQNPVPFLLAEEPPYLTPQGRTAYHFAFEPDTVLAGVAVRVVNVTALPGEGDDQPLRWARLFIEAQSEQIVGVLLRRHSSNLLFGETSTLEITLTPHRGGRWLPERTDYRVALRAPLTSTRHFQLEREYELARDGIASPALRRTGPRS